MAYKAIIVEDVDFLAEQLKDLIEQHCLEIEIISIAHCPLIAEEEINRLKPDLVFMDIELPDMNAFELLEKLTYQSFDIIFTSAFGHYALQAFDHNTIHYLVKPISIDGLKNAVQKYTQRKSNQENPDIKLILKRIGEMNLPDKKIHLPKMNGFTMVSVKDIIRLEAEGRYTKIFIKENKINGTSFAQELICQNIKEFEGQLGNRNFFRCHHSHLVNLHCIKSYTRGEGGVLVMENGESIPVSKSRKEALLKHLKEI